MEPSAARHPLNADTILALAASNPALPHHLEIVRQLAATIAANGGADAVLTGSLAAGTADAHSDIDIDLVCEDAPALARLKDATARLLHTLGTMIAAFPATHLRMPDLLIYFLKYRGELVKVDLHFMVRQPAAAPASPDAAAPDLAWMSDLYNKFCGWMWYTHTKIARGEYWEADDALCAMRAQALLPLLQVLTGMPREGYRRVEQRFAPAVLAQLQATRPRAHEHAALYLALFACCDLFGQVTRALADQVGDGWRTADLEQMRMLVARAAGVPH